MLSRSGSSYDEKVYVFAKKSHHISYNNNQVSKCHDLFFRGKGRISLTIYVHTCSSKSLTSHWYANSAFLRFQNSRNIVPIEILCKIASYYSIYMDLKLFEWVLKKNSIILDNLPHKQVIRAKNGVASLSKEPRNHSCTVSPTDNVSLFLLLLSSIL